MICRTFRGNKQQLELAWVKINTQFLSTRTKCAILSNRSANLILSNVKGFKEVIEENCKSRKILNNFDGISNAIAVNRRARLQKRVAKD